METFRLGNMPTKTSKNCQISVSATYFMMKNCIAFSCFACLLFSGCASVSPQRGPSAALRLSPQWRQPTGSNVRTIEVFVENQSGKAVELSDIALSAGHAPAPTPLWRQVRPSGPVPAGGHAVAALCFTNTPPPFTLSLRAGDDGHTVSVPAFRMPGKLIADVAWSADSRTAYLKAESRGVPVKELLVNGRAVPFEVLKDGRTGFPLVLAAPVRPGSRALFEAVFADGERAFASTRPLPGPVLDVQSADAAARRRLKADKEPCGGVEMESPGPAPRRLSMLIAAYRTYRRLPSRRAFDFEPRKMLANKPAICNNCCIARIIAVGRVAEMVPPHLSSGDFAMPAAEARVNICR